MSISIKAEIARRNFRYVNIARAIKMPTSTFYKKLENNAFSIKEAEDIFSAMKLNLLIVDKESKNF